MTNHRPSVATDLLKDRNGEGSSFTSAGLGLCNDIVPFNDGYDRTLLDSGWTLKTEGEESSIRSAALRWFRKHSPVSVNASKQLRF